MIDTTHQRLQDIADRAGWSDHTLLLLIARWADHVGQARTLVEHLDQIASDEDQASTLD